MARPPKEIKWELVEKKMESGCTAREIAADLRIDTDTFYKRFKEEFGKSFGDYSAEYFSAGDGNIKFTQYMKALSGANHMLILLGRERLGQGKEQEKESPYEDILAMRHENMMLKAQLASMVSESLKEPENGDKP